MIEKNWDGSGFLSVATVGEKNHKTKYFNRSVGLELKPIFTDYATEMLTAGPWRSVKSNLGKEKDIL